MLGVIFLADRTAQLDSILQTWTLSSSTKLSSKLQQMNNLMDNNYTTLIGPSCHMHVSGGTKIYWQTSNP